MLPCRTAYLQSILNLAKKLKQIIFTDLFERVSNNLFLIVNVQKQVIEINDENGKDIAIVFYRSTGSYWSLLYLS